MEENRKEQTIMALFEAFERFGKVDWCCSPVPGLKRSELFTLFGIKKITDEKDSAVKVTDISRMLDVTPPTVTQLLNNLEKNGYIVRRHDREDRRAVIVELTDKAHKDVGFAAALFRKYFEGLMDHLGEEKSEELARLLGQVFDYCESHK